MTCAPDRPDVEFTNLLMVAAIALLAPPTLGLAPRLRLALVGYAATLVLGAVAGLGLDAAGWVDSPGPIAVTLSATSLGLVVPVLKNAGQDESRLGQTVVTAVL